MSYGAHITRAPDWAISDEVQIPVEGVVGGRALGRGSPRPGNRAAGNVDERLGDRLRDVEQFAEAARRMAEEALDLVEAANAEEPKDDGV